MKAPDNSRSVLAWVRDDNGLECWIIDSYFNDWGHWCEAKAWELKVLYWCELPQPPNDLGREGK